MTVPHDAEPGTKPPPHGGAGSPAYLVGLLLSGRKVVVVGGGRVAARRVPKLVYAGAQVELIAPDVLPALAALAGDGTITWHQRSFQQGDLDGAWYAMAATDSAEVNAAVVTEAESRHTFCVRADRADFGSAWTPATGETSGVTVAAVTTHDPLRARRIRDRFLAVVQDDGL